MTLQFPPNLVDPAGSAERDDLQPGMMVGEYRIEAKIGQGGMGAVYRAIHPIIGKKAAVKVISRDLCGRKEAVQRFVQEAQAVNQIGHPNIVDIFSLGTLADERPYFVMELLRGETLHQRILRGALPLSESLDVLQQICLALEATHRQGIIHRDLKPENIFIDDRGERPSVKLLDFGIAKLVRLDASAQITKDGTAMGTPAYASPELARGKPVDDRGDIYSLGVIAFEMLVGRAPFECDNGIELFMLHITRPPPLPSSIWPGIPSSLEQIVLQMLAKDASARPPLRKIRETFAEAALAPTAHTSSPLVTTSMDPARPSQLYSSDTELSAEIPVHRPSRVPLIVGLIATGALGLATAFFLRAKPVPAEPPPIVTPSVARAEPASAKVPEPTPRPEPPIVAVSPAPRSSEPVKSTPPAKPHNTGTKAQASKPHAPATTGSHKPLGRDDDDSAINPYAK